MPIVSSSANILDNDRLNGSHKVVSQVCASINNVFSGDELFFDLENDNNSANFILNETETQVCVDFSSCHNDFTNTSCFTKLLGGFLYDNIEDEPDLTPRDITLTVSRILILKNVLKIFYITIGSVIKLL